MIRSYFTKKGKFVRESCLVPEPSDDEILLKTISAGFCTTDLNAILNKDFDISPEEQGHEGIGRVVKIGKNIKDVKIGDYLSTTSSGCFSTYYLTREGEYVNLSGINSDLIVPNYILEPIACGVNLANYALCTKPKSVLIIGSGLLAFVCYKICYMFNTNINYIGNYNLDLFGYKDRIYFDSNFKYDVVIDLSPNTEARPRYLNAGGKYILGSTKVIDTKEFSWNNISILNPSPRSSIFSKCLPLSKYFVGLYRDKINYFWNTKFYSYEMDKAVKLWKNRNKNNVNRIYIIF